MKRTSRVVRGTAGLAVAALLAAACGTSSTSTTTTSGAAGTSGTSGGGGATAPGVTATQITLGSTQPLTGPAAPGYSEIAPASNAVFKWVNAHGGINGRQIVYNYVDDGYNPTTTVQKTRQLIAQPVFADFDPLGTPTQLQVQSLLNTDKIPQLFVASGCACWSDARFPWTSGWQTNYIIEGKILGKYVATHYAGQKVAYIYQDDEFGQDGVKGLNMEIPKADVVASEPYSIAQLSAASGLGNQVSKAQAAGAKVVIMYTIPAASAESLLAAAAAGYHPQWVISGVGSDVITLAGLLSAFSKGAAGGSLLNGIVSDSYLPSPADTSNAWISLFHQIYEAYDNTKANKFDGNTEYGMAVAFTMVELLKAVGPHLTRADLISTLAAKGAGLGGAGLLPLSYSSSDHYGFQGGQVGTIGAKGFVEAGPIYETTNSASAAITTATGSPATPPSFSSPTF
jgi:ABC-type branched-subunit amino acid transport system substrate-binding protein